MKPPTAAVTGRSAEERHSPDERGRGRSASRTARALRILAALPGRTLLLLIRVYQLTVGPLLPPACRYQPTCSRYAYTAIERHGVVRGVWLTVCRLARCQPWGGSGYDPVPPIATPPTDQPPPRHPVSGARSRADTPYFGRYRQTSASPEAEDAENSSALSRRSPMVR